MKSHAAARKMNVMASPLVASNNASPGGTPLLSKPEFMHRPKLKIRSNAQLWTISVLIGAVVFLVRCCCSGLFTIACCTRMVCASWDLQSPVCSPQSWSTA